MGLNSQAHRLLKARWTDQLLAEELFLILLQDRDQTGLPTSVDQGDGSEPTRLTTGLADDPFPSLNLTAIDFPLFPSNPFQIEQEENEDPDAKQRVQNKTSTQHIRIAIPGQVLSHDGGGLYTVTLYPNSTQDESVGDILEPEPLTAVVSGVKQLDGSTSVADGTWTLVFRHTEFEIQNIRTVEDAGRLGEKELSNIQNIIVIARHHEMQVVTGGSGGGVPVKVVSGGPGDTYACLAYPDGPDEDGVSGTLKILQIDPAETVPADTWLVATKINGVYFGQVPVWL